MKTKKVIPIFFTVAAVLIATLSGCSSKKQQMAQPPVIINFSNKTGQAVPETTYGVPSQQPVVINNAGAPGYVPNNVSGNPQVIATPSGQNMVQASPALVHGTTIAQQRRQIALPRVAELDEASFLNTQIHEIAVQLLKNFRDEPGPEGPIVVTTFVDLNNLYRTSPFGRYIAEQLMGELQRAGFNVVEVRKTENVMIKPKFGEYGLSREIEEISKQSSARYVLTGTYVTRGRFILVNARLVSNDNNLVASSGLKIMRRDPLLDKMLWPSAAPDHIQSIKVPIKELGSLSDVKILSGS